jgi:glycosidase
MTARLSPGSVLSKLFRAVFRWNTSSLAGLLLMVLLAANPSGSAAQTSPHPESLPRKTASPEIPWDQDFRTQTIYSLIPSRFAAGNAENDFYCREHIARGDPHWRGDFAGLILRLDAIRALGFTAICLAPVHESRGAFDFDGSSPYDWLKIDPRLESTAATYRDLLTAAHNRGLKVIQSVILNHCSNYGIRHQVFIPRLPHKFFRAAGEVIPWPYEFNWGNYRRPFRMDNDNPRAPEWFQDWLSRDPWGKGPLIDPKTGTVLPQTDFDRNRFFGTDEADLDPYWFHRNGWFDATLPLSAANLQNRHLATDALDLATENWLVRTYLNQAIEQLVHLGVDGIRIDFAGHVPRADLLPMVNAWKEKHPHLFVFADVFGFGSGLGLPGPDKLPSEIAPWFYSRTGHDPLQPDSGRDSGLGVMDYPLLRGFSTSIADGHFDGLGKLLAWDWVYGDPTRLVTFFHNHEIGPGSDDSVRFSGDSWKAALAYNLLWTVRGIPCLYFGEETAFQPGALLRTSLNRKPLQETGKAYYGDLFAAADTPNHDLYKHIQRLNLIRSSLPALQKGRLLRGNEWVSGLSFIRDYNNGESYAVVGLSAFIDQEITVTGVRLGRYRDAVTGNEVTVASAAPNLTFSVPGNSAGIYVLDGPGIIGTSGPFLR